MKNRLSLYNWNLYDCLLKQGNQNWHAVPTAVGCRLRNPALRYSYKSFGWEVALSIVEARDLCKIYPAFRLSDVSFSLEAGRIAGFIGRNGAGKTVTIKSMLNLVHPDAGEVLYFDTPLIGNEAQIKQRIGYSTGTVSWYPRKPIRQITNVVRTFYPNWDEASYQRYLNMFGLDEDKRPVELSEGMKVNFNLLLALSHKAEVLILDEPTSGLDPFSRDELLELFHVVAAHGVAILFSTHITSDLERCVDDIVYISRGKMRASCPKQAFSERYGRPQESLEDTFLRMEREARP